MGPARCWSQEDQVGLCPNGSDEKGSRGYPPSERHVVGRACPDCNMTSEYDSDNCHGFVMQNRKKIAETCAEIFRSIEHP